MVKKKKLSDINYSEIQEIMEKQMLDINKKEDKALKILRDVKERGDDALIEYTKKFDNIDLKKEELLVKEDEIKNAYDKIDEESIYALKKAAKNIANFHSNSLPEDLELSEYGSGIKLGFKHSPLDKVGCYVPGGKAAYPSSALMTSVPAKIAGVEEIIVTTPPGKNGVPNPYTLVACEIAEVDKIYKIGGVQAIGAMAYGTNNVEKTQKIVGPGGAYVSAAKKSIKKETDIDMVAGPSEITVIADKSSNPKIVAMDLLAQAEHGPDSISILLTNSTKMAEKVEETINEEIDKLKRKEFIKKSLERSIIIKGNKKELFKLSNEIAPEHLEVMTESPLEDLDKIKNAGAIFLGENSPVAIGDYATGCNHVLPTAGLAKTRSGLSTDDFLKKSSVQYLTRKGLNRIRYIGEKIAEIEELTVHKKSIQSRFQEEKDNE